MKIVILLISLFMFGCSQQISRQEVIKGKQECVAAGMDYKIIYSGVTGRVSDVYCIKKI